MFRSQVAAGLFVLASLGGCGQSVSGQSDNSATGVTSIKIRNEYQEKLLALDSSNRDLTLRRAIRDDRGSCAKISGSRYQQDYKGMAMWVAHCSSGDWAVFLAPSGDIQARECADIPTLNKENKSLALPACHTVAVDTETTVEQPRWPEPAPPPKPIDKL